MSQNLRRLTLLFLFTLFCLVFGDHAWAAATITSTPVSITRTVNRGDVAIESLSLENTGDMSLNYSITSDAVTMYTWSDSDHAGGPEYVWTDIALPENIVSYVSDKDNAATSVNLSFDFPFYGDMYDMIYICSNGYINVGEITSDSSNTELPSADSPEGLIAGFFTDLNTSSWGSGSIYFKSDATRAIVQFDQVGCNYDSSIYTFQIVLNVDGTITFYYKSMVGTTDRATIGVQNVPRTEGVTVIHNGSYIKDNLAIQVKPSWLNIDQLTGTILALGSVNIPVLLQTGGIPAVAYTANLTIHDTDGVLSPIIVPVSMTIPNAAPTAGITINGAEPFYVGDEIPLDGSTSADSDGSIASYSWDLNEDTIFGDATTRSTQTSFDTNGDHTVRLQVTDNDGKIHVTEMVVPIANTNPVAEISYQPLRIDVGQEVIFAGTGSSDIDGTIQLYEWDFTSEVADFIDGTGETISKTFAAPGTYTVGLRVTDDLGGQDIQTITVEVLENWARMLITPENLNISTTTDQLESRTVSIENTGTIDLTYSITPQYDLADFGIGGTDAFGYYWIDSDAQGGPKYQWEDISSYGQLSIISGGWIRTEEVALGFDFPFYGNHFNTIYLTDNGFVTLGKAQPMYYVYQIPNTSLPSNMISGFFDEMDYDKGGTVYYHVESDRVIVQYNQVRQDDYRATEPITFQIVLHRSGQITYYYKEIGNFAYGTIGIQDGTKTIGLNINKTNYLHDEMAIHLETSPGWMSLTKSSGTLLPGEMDTVNLHVDTRNLASKTFRGTLALTHNAIQNDPLEIPVEVVVQNTSPVVNVIHSSPYLNHPVIFDASGSNDPDGQILSYGWDLDADGSFDDSVDAITTHTFDQLGEHTVYVQVMDDDHEMTTVPVTVAVTEPPIINVTADDLTYSFARGERTSALTPPEFTITNAGLADLDFSIDYVYAGDPDTYYWTTSDMVGGPAYEWRDIKEVGQKLVINDADFAEVPLGFAFPFYQKMFDKIFVAEDGHLTLSYGISDFCAYTPFPNYDEPNNLIAGLMADHFVSYDSGIYCLVEPDRVTIQWDNTYYVTFQIVLQSNGDITFYYKDIMQRSSYTPQVGIQNEARDEGLSIVTRRDELHNEMAIKISKNPYWLSTQVQSGVVAAGGGTTTVPVSIINNDLRTGDYLAYIRIHHNAPNLANPYLIPVNLTALNQVPTEVSITVTPTGTPFTYEDVTFTAMATDSDNTNLLYFWDTNQDGQFDGNAGSVRTQKFYTPGSYTYSVYVKDRDGAVVIASETITVQNQLPTVTLTMNPLYPDPGQSITFKATGYDPDGGIRNYEWDLDGNEGYEQSGYYLNTVQCSFDQVGDYPVHVQVTDAYNGVAEATLLVQVRNWPKLTITPESIAQNLDADSTAAPNFTIQNTGGLDLAYTVAPNINHNLGGGPDAYGYIWTDSRAANGPAYVWHDISEIGTAIATLDSYTGMRIQLPFDFPFYDRIANVVHVYLNGCLTVGMPKSEGNYYASLPSKSVSKNIIAALANNITKGADTAVHYLISEDCLIVQYTNIYSYSSQKFTFQIVLEKNGVITYYYKDLPGSTTNYMAGIQNTTGETGLTVSYSPSRLTSNLAVRIEKQLDWLKLLEQSGTVLPDAMEGNTIPVPLDSRGLRSVTYNGSVEITHNANNVASPYSLPVSLTVQNIEPISNFTYNTPYVGYPVTFDATAAEDPDGTIISYGWDLDGDGTYTDATALKATQTFATVGSHTVGLEVMDNHNQTTQYVTTIDVQEPPQITTGDSIMEDVFREGTRTVNLNLSNTGGSALNYSIKPLFTSATYTWKDSDSLDGPVFEWNDISQKGYYLGVVSTSDGKDEEVQFSFPFYNAIYDKVYIHSNGYLSFSSTSTEDRINSQFPSYDDPYRLIAGFFDDLDPSQGGEVYYRQENEKLIVQYNQVYAKDGTGCYTFQIVLESNGDITYYYKEMLGTVNSATIGIQNLGYGNYNGVTVAYNQEYVKNEFAVKITNQSSWMNLAQRSGTIAAGQTEMIPITLDASGCTLATYSASLYIQHNVPGVEPISIPVTMTVKNNLPTPVITYSPDVVYTGMNITLDATNSFDMDGFIPSYAYAWDLDNNGTWERTGSTVNISFPENGDYVVGLKVTDNNSGVNSTTIMIPVLNRAPLAKVTHPTSAYVSQSVHLDASTSTDPDGSISSYGWELDGDQDFADASGVSIDTSFASVGIHTVGVRVTDNDGSMHEISTDIEILGDARLSLNTSGFTEHVSKDGAVTKTLQITNVGEADLEYTIKPVADQSIASDHYGYFAMDSTQPGGPKFVWEDISLKGSMVHVKSDNVTVVANLGFTFAFYGKEYDFVKVNSNGYLQFSPKDDTTNLSDSNTTIPNQSVAFPVIAGFYDDLYPGYGNNVYYYTDSEHAIFQWNQIAHDGGIGTYTFQIVLEKDGSIFFYYKEMTGTLNSATIGIQQEWGTDGFCLAYNSAYVENNMAVQIEEIKWLTATPLAGVLPPTYVADITLVMNPAALNPGTYATNLEITHNSHTEPSPKQIPVQFTVDNSAPVAEFTCNSQIVGEITFDATSSMDVDGTIKSYGWDFDNDQDYTDGATPIISYEFPTPGTYTVGLKVVDNLGISSQKSMEIVIVEAPELVVEPDILNVSLLKGETASQTLTIHNPGQSDLYFDFKVANPAGSVNYEWKDSTMPDGPEYVWEDISSKGTRLDVSDQVRGYTYVSLNFPFLFYGKSYSGIYVNSNGYISFDWALTSTCPAPLPTSLAPSNLIAGFFRTMNPLNAGSIYSWQDEKRIIIQYDYVAGSLADNGIFTFQIVLDAYGTITFYYKYLFGDTDNVTIGIQDSTWTKGVTVAHNQTYVQDRMAVQITPVPWLQLSQKSGVVPAGEMATITATMPTRTLAMGTHSLNLDLFNNVPDQSVLTVPVSLTMAPIPPTAVMNYSPVEIYKQDLVLFNAQQSTDDGYISKYEWDLDGDGSYESNGPEVSKAYSEAGTYSVTLRVSDNEGGVDTETITLEVLNKAPQAVMTYSTLQTYQWQTFYLYADTSVDPDGLISRFEWDLDGDNSFDDSNAQLVQNAFNNPGTYPVSLRVIDNDGAVSEVITKTITVLEREVVSNLQMSSEFEDIYLSWNLLKDAEVNRLIVVRKTGGYPTSATDGVTVFDGLANCIVDSDIPAGQLYYGIFPLNVNSDHLKPEFGLISTSSSQWMSRVNYQPGNGTLYSTLKTGQGFENDRYTGWNTSVLTLGKGKTRELNLWLYYPDLIGNADGQIPVGSNLERANLVLKIKNLPEVDGSKTYKVKLYQITDPDGLGNPVYVAQDGYRTGLDYEYRDHRPGREIPWKVGAANIMALFENKAPDAVCDLEVTSGQAKTSEIVFDVTGSLQAWAESQPNQGWLITLEGENIDSNERIELYGATATEIADRPELRVIYTDQVISTRPDPVTNFRAVSDPVEEQITLNWVNAQTYFTGVKILRKEGAIPVDQYDGTLVYDGFGDSWVDQDVIHGKTYYYAMFTYDHIRTYSARESVRVTAGTLPAPVLAEPVVGPGSVTLFCTSGESKIYRYAEGEGSQYIGTTYGGQYVDTNVAAKLYSYWAVGENQYGEGQPSEVKYAEPLIATSLPWSVTFWNCQVDPAENYVQLGWILNIYSSVGYFSIERKVPDGVWVEIAQQMYQETIYRDYAIEPGQTYEYRVSAVNTAGRTTTEILTINVPDYPKAPVDLQWEVISANRVNLSWTDVINEYTYYVDVFAVGTEVAIASYNYGENTTFCSITGLSPNQAYYFRVTVMNGEGNRSVETETIYTPTDQKNDFF